MKIQRPESLLTGEIIMSDIKDSSPKMTDNEIMDLFRIQISNDIFRRVRYTEYERMFLDGNQLSEKDYGTHKIELKFLTRMCKTHASYVLKDMPNIQVPAINSTVPELKMHASQIEKALYTWWKDESILRKLKRGTLRASYKGDMVYYLTVDSKANKVRFNVQEPDFFAYDRVTRNPDSPFRWIMRGELINCEDLRRNFPQYADVIQPTGNVSKFTGWLGFRWSDLWDLKRALVIEVMDQKYLYRFINDRNVLTIEHNYDSLKFYHFKYFDFGEKWGYCPAGMVKDPIKFMNQLIGYQYDLALKTADPPVVAIGNNAKFDTDNTHGGKISIASGDIRYLTPPMGNMPMDKLLDIMKAFLHFISGISEEAMAGFTGALTSAGVSIELRLDSTVREAIDTQITMQDMLETVNADYLKLCSKYLAKKNLFTTEKFGTISDVPFFGNMINGYYNNIIDFGGILPRSADQIVRNVLAKYQGHMISLDTALEELRYMDPKLEKDKINQEIIDTAKQQQDIQAGKNPPQLFFENPVQEQNYMLTEDKLVLPHPAQNHDQHLAVHMEKYSKVNSKILLQHILLTQILKSKAQVQAAPSQAQQQAVQETPQYSPQGAQPAMQPGGQGQP